jgi:hypothetical protein
MYVDRAAWEADASPGVGTIGFQTPAPPDVGYITYDTPQGATYSGVNFVGGTPGNTRFPYYLRAVDPRFAPAAFDWNSGTVLHGPPERPGPLGEGGPNSYIRAMLPANVKAVGSDIMSYLDFGSPFVVQVSTAAGTFQFHVNTLNRPNRAFIGFISPIPIGGIQ